MDSNPSPSRVGKCMTTTHQFCPPWLLAGIMEALIYFKNEVSRRNCWKLSEAVHLPWRFGIPQMWATRNTTATQQPRNSDIQSGDRLKGTWCCHGAATCGQQAPTLGSTSCPTRPWCTCENWEKKGGDHHACDLRCIQYTWLRMFFLFKIIHHSSMWFNHICYIFRHNTFVFRRDDEINPQLQCLWFTIFQVSTLELFDALVLTHSYPCKCPLPWCLFNKISKISKIRATRHQLSGECVTPQTLGNLDTFLLDYIWWFPKNSGFYPPNHPFLQAFPL